jgi:hypothetical protein
MGNTTTTTPEPTATQSITHLPPPRPLRPQRSVDVKTLPSPEELKEYPHGVYENDYLKQYYNHCVSQCIPEAHVLTMPPGLIDFMISFIEYKFAVGDLIDIEDNCPKWMIGRIIGAEGTRFLVHYEGWSSKYDEWVEFGSGRIVPLHTHTRI